MENHFPSILHTLDYGIWSYDFRQGKYTFINPAVAIILEHAEEELPAPDTWLARIHPDDKPSVDKALAQLSKPGKITFEYRYITPEQTIKWIAEERLIIFDQQGQPSKMEGIISDISTQKSQEAENARIRNLPKEAEQNYSYLFEHNPNPMWIYEPATFQFLEVNCAAVQSYGYSRDEFLRMSIKDIRPAKDVPALEKEVGTAKPLNHSGSWQHQRKDGKIIYVNITSHRISYEGKEARLVLALDVTDNVKYQQEILGINETLEQKVEERTRALYQKTLDLEAANEEMVALNEELQATNEEYQTANEQLITSNEKIQEQAKIIQQQSEEKINRILHALHDMVWSVELLTNEVAYLSPAVETIYGISMQEVDDNSTFWNDMIYPDDKSLKEEKLAQAFLEGYAEYTYRIIRADGAVRWLYDRITVTYEQDKTPLRIDGITTDITELIEIQKALEQSEAQLKNAQRIARMGSWESDLLNNKLYWSDEIYRIFGILKGEQTPDFDTFLAAVHPDDREKIKQARQEALEGKKPYDIEHRIVLPNKRVKYVREVGEVTFDEEGKAVWFAGTVQDISERKKMENKILETSERFALASESARIGVWEWNIRENTLFWDKITCSIFEVNQEEFFGDFNTWTSFLHPNSVTYAQQQVEKALRGEEHYQAELKIITATKSVKYVKTYANVLFNRRGQPERMIGVMWDITWQKQAEVELIRYSERLDTVIESITDAFFIIDREWNFIRANQTFMLLNNTSEEKLIGRNIWEVFPRLKGSNLQKVYQQAMDENKSESLETYDPATQAWYYVSVYPSLEGLAIYARDITERKTAEEEKSHLIQNLFAQNKYLEEFAFITSHNLRAPVARIMGLAGIFNREGITDPFNLKVLDNLAKSAQLLDEVIRDLALVLDIRKQEEEMREEIYFENILFEVKELLAQEIGKTKAEIKADFTKAPNIFTIKSYLRNIMLNLVSNAIKYKKLNQPPQIIVESYHTADYLCFSVKDNGLGVDMDKYGSQIFTLYKRFHVHTEGKGMGMYLVKSQVDALGGKIRINSRVNEGTTVEVCLKNDSPKES